MNWLRKHMKYQLNNQEGFTLVEVLISVLILTIIVAASSTVFVFATKVSQDNKFAMVAVNLANERIEYIRSLDFVDVGTKIGAGLYGDPKGEILQTEIKNVDGIDYQIRTDIYWEEEGDWDPLGNAQWDYKRVRVSVVPVDRIGDSELTKTIETYVTRDSTQPPLEGGNIRLRLVRGWNNVPGSIIPVSNVKVTLAAGPSAPRQLLTSPEGTAKFLDLSPGNYTVNFDPNNIGMIVHPAITSSITIGISDYDTQTREVEVDYPCKLHITLKNMDGNPITMNSSSSGKLILQVPYPVGGEINKTFYNTDVNVNGNLPEDLITGLWPLDDSDAGVYSISNVILDNHIFFGAKELTESGETIWSGKFESPDSFKNITCYFLPYPSTPGGISNAWTSGNNIIQGSNNSEDEDGNIIDGIIRTADLTEQIKMPMNKIAHFNASSIFFENSGRGSTPGLYIDKNSDLFLHTGLVVFRGAVNFRNVNMSSIGEITLLTSYQNGDSANFILGEDINGETGVRYGKLFVSEPITRGGITIVEPGGYYFHHGLVLPKDADYLIPITMDNYIE